jgi:flagellar motor switch protein FliN/FliY
MESPLQSVLRLEVPIIVEIGNRMMRVRDVVSMTPGAIIELPKNADEELELKVNNKTIGTGVAVKVGENFGMRISFIGDVRERLDAIAGVSTPMGEAEKAPDPHDAEAAAA